MTQEWQNTRKHNTQESQEVSPFQTGDHLPVRNRQDSTAKTNIKIIIIKKKIHKRSTALECSVKILEGLNLLYNANTTLSSDVDQNT